MAERQSQFDHLNTTRYPQPTQRMAEVPPQARGATPGAVVDNGLEAGPRVNVMKWSLGCAGLGMMVVSGSIILFLIVMPLVFRSLPAAQRDSIGNRLPFMRNFQPTEAYIGNALPTFAATSAGAIALLQTPVASPTAPSVSSQGGGLSSGVAGDDSGGVALTPVLVTDTPVPPTPVGPLPSPTQLINETATPAATPTLAATQVAMVSVPPTAPPMPLPAAYHWEGFKREQQGWNNCGPANITQVLRYFGWTGTQNDAARWLKPNIDDKNVSPWQMVAFVNNQTDQLGVEAIFRYAGDLTLLKRLITQKFAVIVEKGFTYDGWMGHYMTIIGFDDNTRLFYGLDTYQSVGPDEIGHTQDYDDLDRVWQEFDRTYIVIFPSNRKGELAALLGPDADLEYNAEHALSVAKTEASAKPDNPFAWFNIGTNLVLLHEYEKATYAFEQARTVGGGLPPRMLWYQFGSYEAYYMIGNYSQVLADANTTLVTTKDVEETFYWRGMAEAALGRSDQATADFKHALDLNPNYTHAKDALDEMKNGTFKAPAPPKTT